MLVFPNASLDFGAPPLQTIVVYHILHIVWAPRWWWWCSAAQSCPTLCSPMDCSTSLSPRVCSDLCPLDQWYHPTISSSATPFSSCLQSFPASESFFNESTLCIRWPKYWSFSFSISPSSEYLGLTGWISLQFKGPSRVFFSTRVWKHQFFGSQTSLGSNSYICTWLLEKPQLWLHGPSGCGCRFLRLHLRSSSGLFPDPAHISEHKQ